VDGEQRAVRQVERKAAQGIGIGAVVAQGQVDGVGRDRLARDRCHALELAGQHLERGRGHEIGLVNPACAMVTARVPPPTGSIIAARPASVI
jgi:hypothetical protein